MSFAKVVSQTESQQAHERLLAREQEHTRLRHDEYGFLADDAAGPGARR